MQLILSRVQCPHCNNEATEHYDYKTGWAKGRCQSCKKNFSKRRKVTAKNYEILHENAYGIFKLSKTDGSSHVYMFNSDIEDKVLAHFAAYLEIPEIEPENSFIAQYCNGAFFVRYGKIPDNFIDIYAENFEIHKPFLQAVEKRYPRWKG